MSCVYCFYPQSQDYDWNNTFGIIHINGFWNTSISEANYELGSLFLACSQPQGSLLEVCLWNTSTWVLNYLKCSSSLWSKLQDLWSLLSQVLFHKNPNYEVTFFPFKCKYPLPKLLSMRVKKRVWERARESATASAMVRRGRRARRRGAEGRSAGSQWNPRHSRLLWRIEEEKSKASLWRRREGFRHGSDWDRIT